jgi:hypothetical protein
MPFLQYPTTILDFGQNFDVRTQKNLGSAIALNYTPRRVILRMLQFNSAHLFQRFYFHIKGYLLKRTLINTKPEVGIFIFIFT